MESNIFSRAKRSAPEKTVKTTNEKVKIQIDESDFFEDVSKLSTLQEEMKRDKAAADIISDKLKNLAKDKWCELYELTGKNPGTITLEGFNDNDDSAEFMFVPSDKYLTIDNKKADELRETYNKDIVSEITTFTFDNEMIDKYGEVLSRLIEESNEIDADDKEKIIKAVTTYSITKGTIDIFPEYGKINEMMNVTKPVVSIRNIEVIKA